MSRTVTDSGVKKKQYFGQFSMSLKPYEKAIVEYYSQKEGFDKVGIIRGMIRKYIQFDNNFSAKDFRRWAQKNYVSNVEDSEEREVLQEQLDNFETIAGIK